MRFLINFSYDGSNYKGYATQAHKNTIQDEVERVLSVICKKTVVTYGTSRTDSKVHSLDSYLVCDIDLNITEQALKKAINTLINDDILVKKINIVHDDYFPRFDVESKTYKYVVSTQKDPFSVTYKYYYPKKVDMVKMKEASKYLIGRHDFTSFCNTKTNTDDMIREIYDIKILKENDDIIIYITGNGFLYNMVRIIVGSLLSISSSSEKAYHMKEILEAKDRKVAFFTVPGNGLYLYETKLKTEIKGE